MVVSSESDWLSTGQAWSQHKFKNDNIFKYTYDKGDLFPFSLFYFLFLCTFSFLFFLLCLYVVDPWAVLNVDEAIKLGAINW